MLYVYITYVYMYIFILLFIYRSKMKSQSSFNLHSLVAKDGTHFKNYLSHLCSFENSV